jgi:hypothetical protein
VRYSDPLASEGVEVQAHEVEDQFYEDNEVAFENVIDEMERERVVTK